MTRWNLTKMNFHSTQRVQVQVHSDPNQKQQINNKYKIIKYLMKITIKNVHQLIRQLNDVIGITKNTEEF